MNNDTPQIFGEDAHDYPPDAGSFPEHDGEDFTAFRGWAGWGDRVEPVAPDDDYPQPSFSRYEAASYEQEYPYRQGREPGYPQGPGYVPEPGYARHLGYPQDPEEDRDPSYPPDMNYAPDAGLVPVMEPLPDPREPADAPVPPGHGMIPAPAMAPDRPQPSQMQPVEMQPRQVPPAERLPREMPRQETAPPVMNVPPPARVAPAVADNHRVMPDEALLLPPLEAADPEYTRETSDSLTTESLLHGKRAAPGSGWRRSVYRATGGLLRFGESAAEMRRRDLINRVRTPVAGGHHRVAVLSLKGGVGKTTTAAGLGATLATLRGDRVIAIDANPDRGTLSDKVRLETAATIRDLLNERDQVSRYADVRAFTSQAPSRLEVLASDRDPGVSVAFGADDYCEAAQLLEHFYSICITDCGTGLLHSAMSGVLRLADQVILVSSPSVDGARSASATLDWLEAHNFSDLVRNGVVVLSAIRPKSRSTVDLDRLEHHFAARCRAVARVPYDPHLEEGAEIELELLSSETAEAFLALAAVVGDGLAWPRRLTSRPTLP
jgi:MinD-like ATPase involved in chromosome partitioning or flagellar assembly